MFIDEWIRRGTSESKSPQVPSQNVTGFSNEQVRLFASYTIIHNNTGDDSLRCVGLLLIIAFVSIARVYIKSRNSDTIYEISIVIFPSGRIGEREEKRIKVKNLIRNSIQFTTPSIIVAAVVTNRNVILTHDGIQKKYI